ncbi:MAG: methyltransferase domain-containing protein [Alphaproteobacteria bacterium]|nr:methyltransferase domain-containing protein [Alphaproteobacteria bacterium]
MKTISDINVELFSGIPHANLDVEKAAAYISKIAERLPFEKSTELSKIDWHGKTVVEAGCGAGFKCLPMALNGANVIGIDGSKAQVGRAREHAKAVGVDAEFHVSRLENILSMWQAKNLPKADLIICSAVIHHVSGWRTLVEQLNEILKPGGWLYLTWCDWTLSLSGFNFKNQIAFKSGWNAGSRLAIGKALFGWVDKGRNRMNLPDDSFYADLYSAYYIPISAGRMRKQLNANDLEICESFPPMDVQGWLKKPGGVSERNLKLVRQIPGWLTERLVRWRYYFITAHAPRIFVCKRIQKKPRVE